MFLGAASSSYLRCSRSDLLRSSGLSCKSNAQRRPTATLQDGGLTRPCRVPGEGCGELCGLLGCRTCVEIPLGRGDVAVPHRALDLYKVHAGGGEEAAVGVAQVVPAERCEPCGGLCLPVAPA